MRNRAGGRRSYTQPALQQLLLQQQDVRGVELPVLVHVRTGELRRGRSQGAHDHSVQQHQVAEVGLTAFIDVAVTREGAGIDGAGAGGDFDTVVDAIPVGVGVGTVGAVLEPLGGIKQAIAVAVGVDGQGALPGFLLITVPVLVVVG